MTPWQSTIYLGQSVIHFIANADRGDQRPLYTKRGLPFSICRDEQFQIQTDRKSHIRERRSHVANPDREARHN